MKRPTICTFSTKNLLHNLKNVRVMVKSSKIMAMVKDNGYGHDIIEVSKRLDGHVEAFGVASIDEANLLHGVGIKTPIMLIEGVFDSCELEDAFDKGFWVVFHRDEQINWLKNVRKKFRSKKIHAWIKINSGMNRLGFSPEEAINVVKFLSDFELIDKPIGIMSHFACADENDNPLNEIQKKVICDVEKKLDELNLYVEKSYCNSAAIVRFPDCHKDWVRPGLLLYGSSPLADYPIEKLNLKPVMNFETRLIAIQNLKQNERVGYGGHFKCEENMNIGIAAVGYCDGYPRGIQGDGYVLIEDIPCPLAGRVSMDMISIDLRQIPDAKIGKTVIKLWGEGLPIDVVASFSNRISYDLLTGVQKRVEFKWDEKMT